MLQFLKQKIGNLCHDGAIDFLRLLHRVEILEYPKQIPWPLVRWLKVPDALYEFAEGRVVLYGVENH